MSFGGGRARSGGGFGGRSGGFGGRSGGGRGGGRSFGGGVHFTNMCFHWHVPVLQFLGIAYFSCLCIRIPP
jgi:hypothetical protein